MSKIDYYERQEARRERYIQRAAKARRNAAFAAQKAGEMAAVIPAGQPIHVGHYSEKSDRRYRERIGQTMDKAIGLDDKADYYAEKAKTVGRGGISSDAPDAIVLLEHKLAEREAKQARMKEINAAFRKGDAALLALGMTQAEIDKMRENMPSYFGQPFPSFSLSNNGAEIRRLKKRIEALKATALYETARTAFDGGVIVDPRTDDCPVLVPGHEKRCHSLSPAGGLSGAEASAGDAYEDLFRRRGQFYRSAGIWGGGVNGTDAAGL